MAQLIFLLSKEPNKLAMWSEDLKPLFASGQTPLFAFLSTSSYRPSVRCAAAESLSIIFAAYKSLTYSIPFNESDKISLKNLSSACLGIFGDHDSDVQVKCTHYEHRFLHLFHLFI